MKPWGYEARLLACVVASVGAHLAFAEGVTHLPERPAFVLPTRLTVDLVAPPSAPPTQPPTLPPTEAPKPPEPTLVPKATRPLADEPRRPRPPASLANTVASKDAPASDRAVTTSDTTDEPVFGLTMESTTAGGRGPALPVGNTLQGDPTARTARGPVKPLGGGTVAAAYEVTKMPLPKGRCAGQYTEAARKAGLEGTVVLDLVVGPDGRTGDIKVVQSLGEGLTEAAIEAARGCRFSPGERNGEPVPVRVRGFKIRFYLREGE